MRQQRTAAIAVRSGLWRGRESSLRHLVDGAGEWLGQRSTELLRVALGLVFVWFGALKLVHASPVVDLVARTLPWLSPEVSLIGLGTWEVVVGLGLLSRIALRSTLVLFFVQMLGTFATLVLAPEECFQNGHHLLLTTTGEFVVKNLVLVAAGIVIAGSAAKPEPRG
jgi:putative oxidoreductase